MKASSRVELVRHKSDSTVVALNLRSSRFYMLSSFEKVVSTVRCERFSVQQPENTNTDGKLALLTRVPPHPTLGTLARSRYADCGPGPDVFGRSTGTNSRSDSYLVDPASSHMLVSKIKPCMSKYKPH